MIVSLSLCVCVCLQCFDAVGWAACKKTEWWGAGMVICLERGADLHMAQLMPLPLTVSCFHKIQISFTFLVPADPGSPGEGLLNGCVCVCVRVSATQQWRTSVCALLWHQTTTTPRRTTTLVCSSHAKLALTWSVPSYGLYH